MVEQCLPIVRGRECLAVIGCDHDNRLVAQPRIVERLHEHADGLVVLRGLRHVKPGDVVAWPLWRRGDPLQKGLRGLQRLVRGIVVAEYKEPRVLVARDPLGGFGCDLQRIARAVAMIVHALEAHVDADRSVANHEIVVHECPRSCPRLTKQKGQQRRGRGVVARHLGLRQGPGQGIDAKFGRARTGEHGECPRACPGATRVGMGEADATRCEIVECGGQAVDFGE